MWSGLTFVKRASATSCIRRQAAACHITGIFSGSRGILRAPRGYRGSGPKTGHRLNRLGHGYRPNCSGRVGFSDLTLCLPAGAPRARRAASTRPAPLTIPQNNWKRQRRSWCLKVLRLASRIARIAGLRHGIFCSASPGAIFQTSSLRSTFGAF